VSVQPEGRVVAAGDIADAPLHIVLVEPLIPPNAGNVARLCAATGCALHLVQPLGFSIDDRELKRAGLDYWEHVRVVVHPSLDAYLQSTATRWSSAPKRRACLARCSSAIPSVSSGSRCGAGPFAA
jgi:tRNA(Leu) C34 or U34 (ribose-2'-O)-methylase TrmL